jgi:hypothetical protein
MSATASGCRGGAAGILGGRMGDQVGRLRIRLTGYKSRLFSLVPVECALAPVCIGGRRPSAYEPLSQSAHCLLPRRGALCFAGPLRTTPAPNATGPFCRFGASPGEPPPSIAATNKCLARRNKSRTAKANKRQEKPCRQPFRAPGHVSQRPSVVAYRA